jgi:hypothetical protein
MSNSVNTGVASPCCGDILIVRSYPTMLLSRNAYFCGCGRNYTSLPSSRGRKGK